jgi:hypothetical protein
MFILIVLFAADHAYAHGVHGGFGGRSPDLLLMTVMTSTAAFGIMPFAVKRIGFKLSIGLLIGSFSLFMFTLSQQVRIQYVYYDYYDPITYEMLSYLLVASFIGMIGGGIFTTYHFWGVRPYMSRKITK